MAKMASTLRYFKKKAPKAKNVEEIYFPGEQSHYKRQRNREADEIEVSQKLMAKLQELK